MKEKELKTKLDWRLGVISLALVLILSTALFSCNNTTKDPMPDKDVLYANLEGAGGEATYQYASQYLDRWGFSYYYSSKLTLVEDKFQKYYVEQLPSAYEMAIGVAYDFLDNKYDVVDLTNISEVTTAIIDSYVALIGDDYAIYRSADEYDDYNQDMSGEFCGIGVTIEYNHREQTMLITSVMKDSPAEESGFLPGDYIIGVDGMLLSNIGYQSTVNAIKGPENTTVDVILIRDGMEITLTATRKKLTEHTVYYEMLEGNIGYIQITSFKDNTAAQFATALDYIDDCGAVGVIFDLRSNGGGYLHAALAMLECLVPENVVMTSYSYAGISKVEKTKWPDKLEIPCVVLCNQYSASAAELFTSAIRDYGEMGLLDECIVGTKTYGKGIMQTTFRFTDGSSITMTIAYYYTPLGDNYHGEGITPDVTVENTDDTDAQLNAALIQIWAKTAN